jgi:hypothetical protein
MAVEVDAARRAAQADEILRARAEGHGRPVISLDMNDYRFVAVGSKLFYGKNWRFFTDFLLHHMKEVLGRGWGKQMQSRGGAHPLFRWLSELSDVRHRSPGRDDGVFEAPAKGVVNAVFRFAYAVYLIAHHDRMPPALLRRLRQPSEFDSAVVETFATAAFALAGFSIEMGEVQKGRGPEAEFRARSKKTGKAFSVEAKRKHGWRAPVDLSGAAFQTELNLWVKRKLYAAARKRLENPVYWFELNLPDINKIGKAEQLQTLVWQAIREAENEIQIGGEAPDPAYVFITSHPYLSGFQAGETLIMLEGFHLRMSTRGERVEAEAAMVERDRDRDIVSTLDCFRQVQQVPHSFDGTPDALVGADKKPIDRLRVGQRLQISLPDGTSVAGLATHVVSQGPTATVVLLDEATGREGIIEVPLTEQEQKAAEALGDAVFGNPNGGRRIPDDDPLQLYDFFLEAYAGSTREVLLSFLEQHPDFEHFRNLPTKDLHVRVCREWVKSILADQERRNGTAGTEQAAAETGVEVAR